MQQHQDFQQNHSEALGVGPDELLGLIDHSVGKYGCARCGEVEDNESSIRGVPVMAGVVEGPAAVVRNPKDLKRLNPDSILVCPRMSSVYSIAFGAVAGIVAERGGVLSTAATVARENNLPAVTGVQNALNIIGSGDIIRVDGVSGNVQIISRVQ